MAKIVGTPWRDILEGTRDRDLIFGNSGNDSLYGYGGNDHLHGELGTDYLFGGDGIDTFHFMSGDSGRDVVRDYAYGEKFKVYDWDVSFSDLKIKYRDGCAVVKGDDPGEIFRVDGDFEHRPFDKWDFIC